MMDRKVARYFTWVKKAGLGLILVVFLSLSLWGRVEAGNNQWTSYGPGGGRVNALAIDPVTPNTLYAGTSGGVFKSTDGGSSWLAINTSLTNTDIRALIIDPATPNTLYAGTGGGVFKSTDGGSSWAASNTGLTSPLVMALTIDPATPNTLYAGTNGGVFKSTDGGSSWAAINTGLTDTLVLALAIDPVTPSILYAGTGSGGGVFKSTDSGSNWAATNTGLTDPDVFALAIDPVAPNILYAGTYGGGVFKSTDGGSSWAAINTGLTDTLVLALAIDPATPSILYAGTGAGGMFKSTDGGSNWSAINSGLTDLYVYALAIDSATPNTLYAGTNGGGVFDLTFIDATVSSSGSQVSSLDIGSTDNYVGGTFVITENTGTRNVTGITIMESGTIDAATNLENIKLFYDLDSSPPYDCAGESYEGNEVQFGTTDVDGFSAVNGISAFSGSVAISTTQAMCVYAVLDVGSGAAHNETIEIEISDPSTDVLVSSGTKGPSTTVALSGSTTSIHILDHFLVEAAGGGNIGTQVAGTSFNIQITAQDASNNTVTAFTGTVDIISTATLSVGSGTTASFTSGMLVSHGVTISHTGTFTITATKTAGSENGTSNSFTVNAGALDHFLVEASGGGNIGTQPAGSPFGIKITAQDADNNTLKSFEGAASTVDITSTGTVSAGSGTTASFTSGVLASHSVTISNAGTFTITATKTAGTKSGTSNSFTVNPGALDHFLVEATGGGIIGTQTAGSPFGIKITAQDANNNTVTSITGTTDITSTGTLSAGGGTTATFISGVISSHSVTISDTGTFTIQATKTAGSETGTSNSFTVNAVGLDHFLVEASGGGNIGTQTAGTPFNIQITAQDANNNTVTSFDGVGSTVDITSTGMVSAGMETTASFTSGVLSFHNVVIFNTGTFTIQATKTAGSENGTSNAFQVNPGILDHFSVEAAEGGGIWTQSVGNQFGIKITAHDVNDNTVTSFDGVGKTVDITSTGTLSAGGGTTASFTMGVLSSHSVAISNTGTFTIQATNTSGSENGISNAFTVSLPDLEQIHYRWRNDDGGEVAAWFDPAWGYRIKVTIDPANIYAPLKDFPVLVDLADFGTNFHSKANSDGSDIRVTESNGSTEVPREVVIIDTVAQTGELHFRATRVSSSHPTDFYVYYGNAGASEPAAYSLYGSQNVWSNGYAGVWHLNSTAATDSTANLNDGTANGNVVSVGGKIGTGQSFDGNPGTYIDIDPVANDVSVPEGTMTIWVNRQFSVTGDWRHYFNFEADIDNHVWMAKKNDEAWFFIHRDNNVPDAGVMLTDAPLQGSWTYMAFKWETAANLVEGFVNDIFQGIGDGFGNWVGSVTNAEIGARNNGGDVFLGLLDEARISTVARTKAWLKAAYKNQNNPGPGGFLSSIGSEETQSNPATWAAAEDTILTGLAKNNLKRLRIEISNEGGGPARGTTYQLEVSGPSPTSCSVATYSAVPTAATGHWQIQDSVNFTDGADTINNMSGLIDENIIFVAGEAKDTGNQTAGITLSSMEFTEIEYALQALPNAIDGALYCFRLTDAGSTTDFTYARYAQATVGIDHFLVEAVGGGSIGTQTVGATFNIQIIARDSLGNTVTNFTGTVDVTSTGTLSAGSGASTSFTGGVLSSHSVTISDSGSFTITATKTAGTESGTSNSFTVNPAISPLATISVTPTSPTNSTSVTLTVTGTDIVAYKYKLDSGSYSSEIPVGILISLSGLGEGTHTVSIIGKDANGKWQTEANATTITWTVDFTEPVAKIWLTETVDGIGATGMNTSIVLDGSDYVYISYYDDSNTDLKYATNASGTEITETIDSSGDIGQFSSIALDRSGNVHISYYDFTNQDLKYATNILGTWLTETVDSSGNVGQYTSIALDASDNVHISYYDSTNQDLKYATTDASGTWIIQTVDSSGNVGQYGSIALDSSDKVHISYYDATNQDLKYATDTSGAWTIQTVDSSGNVGQYGSIALDASGKVHISYYYATNKDLKYATNVLGTWLAETVDGNGDVGRYTSIALDASDRVRVSFYDFTNQDLRYASTNASGSWNVETVDSSGSVGEFTSIGLGGSGNVYISYYGFTNQDLKIAIEGGIVGPRNNSDVTFTISGDDLTHYKYSLAGGGYSSEMPAGNELNLSALTEGPHTLSVIGKDAAGNWQAEADATTVTWTVDLTAPAISSTTPANQATGVPLDAVIKATFSEAMEFSTISTTIFSVSDGSTNIEGTVTYVGTEVTFTPQTTLNYDTTYTATITTGAIDLAGNALETAYTWSFTIGGTNSGNNPSEAPAALSPVDEAIFSTGPVTLKVSAFLDPENDTHMQTYWLVRRADRVYDLSDTGSSFYHVAKTSGLNEYTVSGLDPGFKYYWKVGYLDSGSGTISWSEEYSFKVGISEADSSVAIEPGEEIANFKMVSFIQWPDDPSATSVFGDEMGGIYNPDNFKIGTYDPTIGVGGYVEYGDNLIIEPGKAYWFLVRNGFDMTVDGIPVSTNQDIDISLLYNSDNGNGWNMIACPNNANYFWDNVEVLEYDANGNIIFGPAPISSLSETNPYIDKRLWRWEAGSYASDTLWLMKYEGYWVKVKKANVFLRFPVGAQARLTNSKTMMAGILGEGKRWFKEWLPTPRQAIADSDDSPPGPMGVLGVGSATALSDRVGSDVGCFISTVAYGLPKGSHFKVLITLMVVFLFAFFLFNSSATKAQNHPSTICWTYGVNKEEYKSQNFIKKRKINS